MDFGNRLFMMCTSKDIRFRFVVVNTDSHQWDRTAVTLWSLDLRFSPFDFSQVTNVLFVNTRRNY